MRKMYYFCGVNKNRMNNEIQRIISGDVAVRYGSVIQAIADYLRRGEKSGSTPETDKFFKREETQRLKQYIETNNCWVSDINIENYVSEGAEQKVFLKDTQSVIKLNDAIFYLSWVDYFHSLLLNNYFFPNTAYELLGFFENENTLYAVVKQTFVKSTEETDLSHVRQFMQSNGFELIRNNDYFNSDLGIIIEDLHDENVLTNNGVLFFIDTVFYIK
jgi:hypothetical protein